MFHPNDRQLQFLRGLLIALGLIPFLRLLVGLPLGWLGVNPLEFVTRSTGTWTLVGLMLTLSVTPLRRLTGWVWLIRLRRTLGLLSFFYAVLHFGTYVAFDRGFDFSDLLPDILKRPFITVGFLAFVLMLPLALTSSNAAVRRLGSARWRALHRLVYVVAILGVLHYLWLVKRDITEPAIYGAILAGLFAFRIIDAWNKSRAARFDANRASRLDGPASKS